MPAGQVLSAALLARRVNTAKLTADSATFTAETSVLTVAGVLVAGWTYAIVADVRLSISTGTFPVNETNQLRIREDGVSGTQLNIGQYAILSNSGVGFTCRIHAEYTAVASGSKTFALTSQRNSGSANHQVRGSAAAPGFLFIELLSS
ncbi:hypothetical protein AMIS_20700 [Actinoplanes missouriensis 431]|uniref:Uncharacterized protein n=1 Tax=Actinoplanes missouriensis (strain ATCC 14538 / DSM 43046 / CBS 188.64 / JCM 3121 / NBRC 102363 / NCIMB 12654 / NRRL B-3342 / UNCC 431) TaxID=512565 RepID=I0H2Q3_ACTM4|nr:hypothetical protein [Actinoplanes missouriensis]BAL87290.1 hypothetical protein AMIS_20700 [Actinoplanes missouriensis 431]